MSMVMAATQAADKKLSDAIFGASAAAKKAVAEHGLAKVTDATIGVLMGDDEKIACLAAVEKAFRSLPMERVISYAPIVGAPDYLSAVIDETFGESRPEGFLASVATAGGTGAIHHAIANYANVGEYVLTADWHWGTYGVICREIGSRLTTYQLFDEAFNFNFASFSGKVEELLRSQDSLLVIINTPAHNPTGYSLSEDDWDKVLSLLKRQAKSGKRISLLIDIAYIDYGGEPQATRRFMQKFSGLDENILVMFAFSMSKGYTMYGQRTGALIALSSSKGVIDNFKDITKYSSRATWSNINCGAMEVLAAINRDDSLRKEFLAERSALYSLIEERASVFMEEAESCSLTALPYKGGFFIAVPSDNPSAVAEKLHDDLIFTVALKKGLRIAACSVPKRKMTGLATKIKKALEEVG